MKQVSFASLEYAGKKRVTRREKFLGQMQKVVPWQRLLALIEPHYPSSGRVGRPPIGLERMLRMYFVQQWYALSDEALEDALYDSCAMREFVGIDLARESAPDATTLLKFRRLLETHQLTETIFATIIAAPSSTKNAKGERDAEMHQTKKGKQWHFGMKAHIGVDAASGLVHTVIGTAANVNDVTQAQALLHGDEREGYGDAGYQGADKRPEARGKVRWNIAMRPGKRRALDISKEIDQLRDQLETIKARIRAKVEHPFHIIKNRFGLKKVRYRGLAKNAAQLMTLFALANLMIAKRRLLGLNAQGAS